MDASEMRAKVRSELAHIPDWPEPQRELRMAYWNLRMANLGRKRRVDGTALEVVRRCIGILQPSHPGHRFEFDERYFRTVSDPTQDVGAVTSSGRGPSP